MLQSKEELEVLSDESTDVFKQLAQFESYYYKKSTSENDYQPEIIEEDIEDKDNDFVIGLPKKIPRKVSWGND